jgi:hypothetical protein
MDKSTTITRFPVIDVLLILYGCYLGFSQKKKKKLVDTLAPTHVKSWLRPYTSLNHIKNKFLFHFIIQYL